MRKFARLPAPEVLVQNGEKWGQEWEQRHAQNPLAQFIWHTVNKQDVKELVLPALQEQTQGHCSFCDAYPVSPPSNPTIEHFRPKSKFPQIAYKWENLYYCCDFCQTSKGNKFEEALLAPDAPDFDFDRYFQWDFTNGYLLVNKTGTPEDQNRARVTIELYGLNKRHPQFRKEARLNRPAPEALLMSKTPYRGFVLNPPPSHEGN